MPDESQNAQSFAGRRRSRWLERCLGVLVVVLAVLTASIPGALHLMRRADAQAALGSAKSLRLALQAASTEAYAAGEPFLSPGGQGGVTEKVWRQVITEGRIPGDFWVLQTGENGYDVRRFLYQEGDFTVSYCSDPLSYEVYYRQQMVKTRSSPLFSAGVV